jgi:hypothetical protein
MKKQPSNYNQLSFSYGRPLSLLLEEIKKTTRNPILRKEAEKMLESLRIFELVGLTASVKSVRARIAIQELLTK